MLSTANGRTVVPPLPRAGGAIYEARASCARNRRTLLVDRAGKNEVDEKTDD
jgi:hypothetical protein